MKKKLISFIFFFSIHLTGIHLLFANAEAAPKKVLTEQKSNEKAKKENGAFSWSGINPSENIEFHLIEDFESNLPWEIANPRAVRNIGRFITKGPLSSTDQIIRKQYQEDIQKLNISARLHRKRKVSKQVLTYEMRFFFVHPGQDSTSIFPDSASLNNFLIKNRPVYFAIWVYSTNKNHRLYALFKNAHGKKYSLSLGKLNFLGWKRMNAMIPDFLQRRNPLDANKYEIQFEGLKIQSHKSEERGLFLAAFDIIMLITDNRHSRYSGSQMRDF